MDVEALLNEEEVKWRELLQTFDAVPADRFEEAGVTREGWSPKDVMFHLGAWLAECKTVLDRLDSGSSVEDDDDDDETDQKNAAWFNMGHRVDIPTVRAGFESARKTARDRFAELSDPSTQAWNWFEESGPIHYVEHGKDLRSWLDRA